MLFTHGRLLIFALALTLISLPAWARDLVVAPGHPQSSDSNSGSPESALKTIARAAEIVEPGDRVIIKPGLFRETIPLKRSGAPGAPISFVAETRGLAAGESGTRRVGRGLRQASVVEGRAEAASEARGVRP